MYIVHVRALKNVVNVLDKPEMHIYKYVYILLVYHISKQCADTVWLF